jgi:CHAD domain-containing protein
MLRRLPPLLAAFSQEIDGVRIAEDIEYIHRMRVASRRLRAALPLFRSCFPKKQYGRWMNEIAGITRALGEARDADVQIAFLQKYKKKRLAAWQKRPGRDGSEPPTGPAVRYLLAGLQKRRSRHQQQVLSALESLEKSRVIPDMEETFLRLAGPNRRIPREELSYGVPTLAAYHIAKRLATLLSYEEWVDPPDAVAEHHATRIAAKKLRYTMETFGPVYRLGLAKQHARVRKIQEILGDLHDCDVWIDHITRLLLRERSRFRSGNGEKRPDTATIASLKVFLQDREKERILLHRRFRIFWESQHRAGTWTGLRSSLVSGRRKLFIPAGNPDAEQIRAAAEELAGAVPEVLPHERHVTRLALLLFDSTRPLHSADASSRHLLEWAGILHDIGWKGGRKNHHLRGAEEVICAESLPLDCEDRIIIALAIFSHRSGNVPDDHPLCALLSPSGREQALRIAAILRVADGLDYEHLSVVHEIHCVIGTDTVACNIIATGEAAVEREHARRKAGLFKTAFGRELILQ